VGWDNVNLFLHMSNWGRVRQIHPKNKVFPMDAGSIYPKKIKGQGHSKVSSLAFGVAIC